MLMLDANHSHKAILKARKLSVSICHYLEW